MPKAVCVLAGEVKGTIFFEQSVRFYYINALEVLFLSLFSCLLIKFLKFNDKKRACMKEIEQ